MGLRLPIYPYYAAQGKPGAKKNPEGHYNKLAKLQMEEFRDHLSRDDVMRIARNIIPAQGELNISNGNWFRPSEFDEDDVNHVGLASLMERVGKYGTILIPDITHIIGKVENRPPTSAVKELMKQFDLDDIEVLPLVFELNGKTHDLKEYPKKYTKTRNPDPELFELMPQMARATVDYLKRYVMSGSGPRSSPAK